MCNQNERWEYSKLPVIYIAQSRTLGPSPMYPPIKAQAIYCLVIVHLLREKWGRFEVKNAA